MFIKPNQYRIEIPGVDLEEHPEGYEINIAVNYFKVTGYYPEEDELSSDILAQDVTVYTIVFNYESGDNTTWYFFDKEERDKELMRVENITLVPISIRLDKPYGGNFTR